MRRINSVNAGRALVAGLTLTGASWGVDVLTCAGEVEVFGGDTKVAICDENPQHDNWFNNPGTPEQKLMDIGGLIAVIGAAGLMFASRQEAIPDSQPL